MGGLISRPDALASRSSSSSPSRSPARAAATTTTSGRPSWRTCARNHGVSFLGAPWPAERATYAHHDHHASVVSQHARRTAQDSAAFLLPHLQPHFHVLDVGCGPGTITADLAELVSHGQVIGIDMAAAALVQARAHVDQRNLANVEFRQVDAHSLPFPDDHFDVVFCHQVLQHVKDPIRLLKEMKRVAKKGSGLVAAREADYKSFTWSPEPPALTAWAELYQKLAKANGGEPNAGRCLRQWARDAGFEPAQITTSWSSWSYVGDGARHWGEAWQDRALHSNFATGVLMHHLGTEDDLTAISEAWKAWAEDDNAFIVVPNGEILCLVPE